MARNTTGRWLLAAGLTGLTTWLAATFFGTGPLRTEAPALAALAALFVFGARFIKAPRAAANRRGAPFGRGTRRAILAVLAVSTVLGLGGAVRQAREGYPPLTPEAVLLGQEPPRGFFAAEGVPVHAALYTVRGSEGERFLVPLDAYEGRLLVLMTQRPPVERVRVTGRVRDDVRGVQRPTEDITQQGPFLPLYREHMRLPPNTPVYFLDTSLRAGLNTKAVALFLVPGYLFLLVLGVPARPRT